MELALQSVFVLLLLLTAFSPGIPHNGGRNVNKLFNVCGIISSNCRCISFKEKPDIICKFETWLPEKSQTLLQSGLSPERRRQSHMIGELDVSGSDLSSLSDNFLSGVTSIHKITAQECRLTRIPHALLQTETLRQLDISNNNITALSFDVLTGLGVQELNLTSNGMETLLLKGQFPEELRILDVSNNELRELPLTAWQQLQSINVSRNVFSRLPTLLSKSKLQMLDLSRNSLSKFPADFLRATPSLRALILAKNVIQLPKTALPSDLNLTQLLHLDLSGNGMQQVSPALLSNCRYLQVLDLSHNKLTTLFHDHDVFPQHNSHLLTLDLSHNTLVNIQPDTFFHLHRLRDLDLSSNPGLGKMSVNHISFPEHLASLDLSNCSLRGVDYCQLSKLHDLTMLHLANNPFKCTCDLYMLYTWYRSDRRSLKAEGDLEESWQCLTADGRSNVSIPQHTCSDFIHCPSADPIEFIPDVHVSVHVIVAEHNLITSWTVSNISQQMFGFRVFYTQHGVEGVQAVQAATHVSPVLGVNLRSYALTDIDSEQSYTVCVDVLSEDSSVLKRVCETVSGKLPNAIVGILAATVFLIPCAIFVIFIVIKDKSMRLHNLQYVIDVDNDNNSECQVPNVPVNTAVTNECELRDERDTDNMDAADGHNVQNHTTDSVINKTQTVATQTDLTSQEIQPLPYTGVHSPPLAASGFYTNTAGMESMKAHTLPRTRLAQDSQSRADLLPRSSSQSLISKDESQACDPVKELDDLVTELMALVDNEGN